METYYMNTSTGSVGQYDDWWFTDEESGKEVNAVDLGEVVEVKQVNGEWVLA